MKQKMVTNSLDHSVGHFVAFVGQVSKLYLKRPAGGNAF